MPSIWLSNDAMNAIRATADNFKQTATRAPGGGWNTPISDEVLERLKQHQLPGETLSDTVLRAVNLAMRPRQ